MALAATLGASLLGAVPAAGDWLVTKSGARVQTRGPWRVNGQQVLFTDTSGSLVSMPLVSVDIAASRSVTAEAGKPPARPTPCRTPARQTRLVISDADVGHVAPGLASAALPTTASEAPTSTPSGPPKVTLYSASWCPWCRKARELLTRLGVPYAERDVDKDPRARGECDAKAGAGAGLPVLDIGGTIVRGYDEATITALVKPRPAPR